MKKKNCRCPTTYYLYLSTLTWRKQEKIFLIFSRKKILWARALIYFSCLNTHKRKNKFGRLLNTKKSQEICYSQQLTTTTTTRRRKFFSSPYIEKNTFSNGQYFQEWKFNEFEEKKATN